MPTGGFPEWAALVDNLAHAGRQTQNTATLTCLSTEIEKLRNLLGNVLIAFLGPKLVDIPRANLIQPTLMSYNQLTRLVNCMTNGIANSTANRTATCIVLTLRENQNP